MDSQNAGILPEVSCPQATETAGADFSNIRLLYVEDDNNTRDILVLSLRHFFQEIHLASNGEEGLEIFDRIHPDIVISDLRMPGMSGLEMTRKIREKNATVPVIVTTAYSDLEVLIEAVEAGIVHYLIKPVYIQDLLESVKKSLRLK
jgi:DNA-binding response OmpR family regulator